MKKIFQPRKVRERKERTDKFINTGFVLLFILFATACATRMLVSRLDAPQAATHDEGKTVDYFVVPTKDNKGFRKVFPKSNEFVKLMREGKYEMVHVAGPAVLTQMEGGGK